MEAKQNLILVPTDFSEVGINAINLAAKAAKLLSYKMCLVHIVDKKEDGVEEKLEALAKDVRSNYGVEVSTLAKEGSIFSTIAEVAKDLKASLMYMATHGKVGMQKLTGSFALKVVTSSEVPVIVVQKRSFENTFKDIVLPVTSDSGPWEKTKWATHIAKEFNAKIHIYQLGGDSINEAVKLMSNHFDENEVSYEIKQAEKAGSFSKQVIDYATAINSDLIMIMTNPEKGVSTFILGSYDEDMIFNPSQIPVMCINPRDFNWKKIVSR